MTKISLAAAIILHGANAHYTFNRLIVNNTVSKDYQYTRDTRGNDGSDNLWLKAFPVFGPEDANVTCGRMSFPVLNSNIETAIVLAGDDVGFMVSGPYFEGDTQPYIFHEGPGQIFMSKLPDGMKDLKEYDGSGDFFKVGYAGPANSTTWSLDGSLSMNFTVPKTTPSGKYLLRMEQFYAAPGLGESQWYVNCAHVEIVGGQRGTPGPMVRFPNAYKAEDPSVWFHEEGTKRFPKDITVYIEPKPPIWKG